MTHSEINNETHSGYLHPANEIDTFARTVISSTEQGFAMLPAEHGGTHLRTLPLGQYLPRISFYLDQLDSGHAYGEHLQMFRDACENLGLQNTAMDPNPHVFYPAYGKCGAELFNDLLKEIRTISRSLEFKKKTYDRHYGAVRNYQSCERYIDALFARHARLLVLRLDFGYRKAQCGTLEEVQKDIERYLNNRRNNRLFDTWVGYIIKLECTAEKGPHFHCIFFLDGSASYKDVYLAHEYGQYWERITEGRGIFFNCNLKKHDYDYCGVGMIHHADAQLRKNLLLPVRYITKPEQAVLMKASPKSRTLWKGESPAERTRSIGRPRKNFQDESC
jgi:hypothetical protein